MPASVSPGLNLDSLRDLLAMGGSWSGAGGSLSGVGGFESGAGGSESGVGHRFLSPPFQLQRQDKGDIRAETAAALPRRAAIVNSGFRDQIDV
jgi:hypothetical protein